MEWKHNDLYPHAQTAHYQSKTLKVDWRDQSVFKIWWTQTRIHSLTYIACLKRWYAMGQQNVHYMERYVCSVVEPSISAATLSCTVECIEDAILSNIEFVHVHQMEHWEPTMSSHFTIVIGTLVDKCCKLRLWGKYWAPEWGQRWCRSTAEADTHTMTQNL
jgi:hypothetical protein